MRRKSRALLVLILLTLPWLTGCWNRVEIEEGAYALALGIDKGDVLPYSITVAIAKPSAIVGEGGGGSGKEDKPVMVVTVEAPSLAASLSMMNSFVGRHINLHHVSALFVHEDLAREGGLQILDELMRFRETRQTMFFIITREKAARFLEELDPLLEKNPMRFIEKLTYNYRRTAMLPAKSQVSSFVSHLDVAYAQPLTYYAAMVDEGKKRESTTESHQAEAGYRAGELPRKGGANVEMVGAAAFRQRRMVGVLSGDEIRNILILQDQFRQALSAFEEPKDPQRYVSIQLNRGRPFRMEMDLSGPRPRIAGRVTLEAELLGVQSGIDYSEPEMTAVLERAIARQVKESIEKLIAKTQEWETDVVGFGRHAVALFPTVDAWEQYNWPEKYPEAEIEIDVSVRIRRFGLIFSPVRPSEAGGGQ